MIHMIYQAPGLWLLVLRRSPLKTLVFWAKLSCWVHDLRALIISMRAMVAIGFSFSRGGEYYDSHNLSST